MIKQYVTVTNLTKRQIFAVLDVQLRLRLL